MNNECIYHTIIDAKRTAQQCLCVFFPVPKNGRRYPMRTVGISPIEQIIWMQVEF
jgi:hypothetical protein